MLKPARCVDHFSIDSQGRPTKVLSGGRSFGEETVQCAGRVDCYLRVAIEAEIELLRDSATAAQGLAASNVAEDLDDAAGLPVVARANRRAADRLQRILDTALTLDDPGCPDCKQGRSR